MEYENYSFQEAIKHLAEKAGITLPEIEYSEEAKSKESKRAKLFEINKEAAKYYYFQLRGQQGAQGLDYLKERGLTDETMHHFGLGYSLKYADGLLKFLKNRGYDEETIRDAGLANVDEKNGMYDKFWNRVMFPIQDINHRVIGFGGRVMGDGKPKYLNSPETLIFDKSRNLYGLNFARTSRKNHMILCEGYMDVIALHQAGFPQAVASLGTAFTSGQANLLRRYTEEVLLTYDSDEAGIHAALRALPVLKEAGISGKVINLEPYKDPDEFIKNLGSEEFENRIRQAENSFFYDLRMLEREYDLKDPESKTKFYNEIAKKLCNFSEEVERENYVEATAEKYHIGFDNLRKLVTTYAAKTGMATQAFRPKSGIQSKADPDAGSKRSQRLLLTWLAEDPGIFKQIKALISEEDFTTQLYQKVAKKLLEDLNENRMNPASIISMFTDEEEQREVASLFNTKIEQLETQQEKEKAFRDILLSVKTNSYEYYSSRLGADVSARTKVIEARKALEELRKIPISLENK